LPNIVEYLRIRKPINRNSFISFLNKDEIDKIIDHCNSRQMRAFLSVYFETGARVIEICKLRKSNCSFDENETIALDENNNVYLSNWCSTNYIQKYNSTGTVLWAQTVASVTNVSAFNSVCTDKNGYIYAAGYTSYGTYSFGTLSSAQFNNTSSSTSNSVIVKYDPSSGNALWAQTVIPSAASGTSLYNSVNVDTSGNAYTAGYISGNNHGFGNGVNAFGIYNGNNAVLAKYNTSGNALWARTLTAAPDQSQFYGVNVDSSGNIYSVGSINGTGSFTFDTLFNPLTVAGSRGGVGNAVIVKYLQ